MTSAAAPAFPPPAFGYALVDGVATVTFDKPDRLNAFTRAMAVDLIGVIDRLDSDDAVRAIILTGAGRAFCAGADLSPGASALSGNTRSPLPHSADGEIDWSDESLRDFGGLITLRLFDCNKPVIVAFNGPAAGMGVTMALAADFRLASTTAKFALPFVRRGIVPESASSWFLPRIVGLPRALEWMLTGATIFADEALAAGLVRSLHAPADLLPAAQAIGRQIATQAAPVSVALTRHMMWRITGAEHPMSAHRIESRGIAMRARSSDAGEGVRSFLEKRDPHFSDTVSRDMPGFHPWWDQPPFA